MRIFVIVFTVATLLMWGFGCSYDDEELNPEAMTSEDREGILDEALDNWQIRGTGDAKLIYVPNQEKPYTGWIVMSWKSTWEQQVTLHRRWEKVDAHGDWDDQYFFQVRDGKVHGTYTRWLSSGQKIAEGRFTEGYADGTWTSWHENGQKAGEGTYKNGGRDGAWTFWHDNGQKEAEGLYKNGGRDGAWTSWYDNGQKEAEGTYKHDLTPEDRKRRIDSETALSDLSERNNRNWFSSLGYAKQGMWTSWYDNGQKRSEGTYKNGERDGAWIFWTEDGEQEEVWFGKSNFVSADPPGGEIAANGTITITFDNAPADITVSAGTVRVTGKTATITGPFAPGPLELRVVWTDGSTTLNYTVRG